MQKDQFYIRRLQWGLGAFLLAALFYFGRTEVNILFGGDTWGYYGYLPSLFIYGDIKRPETTYLARFNYSHEVPKLPEKQGEFTPAPNGNNAIKYTSGVAVLQLPFFLIAHAMAAILPDVAADGYSWPYRYLINLSVIFYFLLSIRWLFLLLRQFFSPQSAVWTIVLLALGSNLFNFLIFRGPMAHGYLFSLYALLSWQTYRFYEAIAPGKSYTKVVCQSAAAIGLSAGLITLIRPVEIICLAIPLFYGLATWQDWRLRPALWGRHYKPLLLSVGLFIMVGMLQLFYWKYVTDHWLFFSYGEERFFWDKSKIFHGMFNYRNGWLIYSPILWIGLAGILRLFKKRQWLWPLLVFLPLHIYITYAWWNWYYINGFGSRPMVETYALLAIPFAASLEWARQNRFVWLRWPVYIFALACVGLNLFQHEQHVRGVLWPESANKAYYWSVFGKLHTDRAVLTAFVTETAAADTTNMSAPRLLYRNTFEDTASDSLVQNVIVAEGQQALAVPPRVKYYGFFKGKLSDILGTRACDNRKQYLEIRVHARKEVIESPHYLAPGIVVEGSWPGGWKALRLDPFLGNTSHNIFFSGSAGVWEEIRYFYPLPSCPGVDDQVSIFLDNGKQITYLDDLQIYLWTP